MALRHRAIWVKESVEYCNCIAEILSIATKIEGNNDVNIRILQNIEFMAKSAKRDFREEEIDDCFSMLGASTQERHFWENVLDVEFNDEDDIYSQIRAKLGVTEFDFTKIDYENWSTSESKEMLNILDAHNLLDKIDLSALQTMEFHEAKHCFKPVFIHSLWTVLAIDPQRQGEYIKIQQDYDHIQFNENIHKLLSYEEYVSILTESIKQDFNITVIDYNNETHLNLYPEYAGIINELPIESQSLFYFENNDERIKLFQLELENEQKKEEATVVQGKAVVEDVDFAIISCSDIKGSNIKPLQSSSHIHHGCVHTKKSERQKERAGKEAELLVNTIFPVSSTIFPLTLFARLNVWYKTSFLKNVHI